MGFFSRETTVDVASVIYPLGEELDKIPDVVKAAIITASMRSTSQAEAIDTSIFDGAGIKLAQGYKYAARSYYAGLPDGFSVIHSGPDDALLEMLCREYLMTVYPTAVIDVKSVEVVWGSNADVIVRNQIESAYNYDFFADAVHTAVGAVDVGAVLVYEVLPSDAILHPDEVGYHLDFTNPDTSVEPFDEWYNNSLFVGQTAVESRLVMEVSLDGDPAITLYYAYGGSDPRLNLFLRDLSTPRSGTFPAIVLKKDGEYLDTDDFNGEPWAASTAYKTSKKYGQRLGINIDDLLTLVKDNPDQKDIDYAFIQPGTLISSPTVAAAEYHYRYFYRLFLEFPDNKPAYDTWVATYSYPDHGITTKNNAKSCPAQSVHVLDPDDTKNTVNMSIAWRYITYEEKSGSLSAPFIAECGTQEEVKSSYPGKVKTYDVTKMYFRKRLTDSTYAELVVVGLWHENYIYKKYKVQSGIWDMFNDSDGDFGTGFLIPLEYEIFIAMSGRERLQLSQEAFHIIFNCYQVTKQSWYQTGIFKVVLAIIAVVIIYFSWGTLTSAVTSVYGAISASLATVIVDATVVAALATILTAVVVAATVVGVNMAAKAAGKWAAEQWGPAWGAIVQIAVTIALTYGITSGLESFTTFNMPPVGLAESVFNASSMILSGVATYTEAQYAQLREAQGRWTDYLNSPNNPMAELEKLMNEWFPDDSMTTTVQNALFGPKESLDQFLGRTLTLVDGLTYRLTLPIQNFTELTLTPRLA